MTWVALFEGEWVHGVYRARGYGHAKFRPDSLHFHGTLKESCRVALWTIRGRGALRWSRATHPCSTGRASTATETTKTPPASRSEEGTPRASGHPEFVKMVGCSIVQLSRSSVQARFTRKSSTTDAGALLKVASKPAYSPVVISPSVTVSTATPFTSRVI